MWDKYSYLISFSSYMWYTFNVNFLLFQRTYLFFFSYFKCFSRKEIEDQSGWEQESSADTDY